MRPDQRLISLLMWSAVFPGASAWQTSVVYEHWGPGDRCGYGFALVEHYIDRPSRGLVPRSAVTSRHGVWKKKVAGSKEHSAPFDVLDTADRVRVVKLEHRCTGTGANLS